MRITKVAVFTFTVAIICMVFLVMSAIELNKDGSYDNIYIGIMFACVNLMSFGLLRIYSVPLGSKFAKEYIHTLIY